MTRFSWLQTRSQTLLAIGLLAVLAIISLITGIQLSHYYSSHVSHCTSGCDFELSQYLRHDQFMDRMFDIVGRAVPALLGIFWGAPLLAREYEAGTYRLAWTQGISRTRWVLTRLAVGALATAIVAGLLTLTITRWYHSRDHVNANKFGVFDRRDIVPIGYALFAFASGALLGAIMRRTVPAMAATLAVFIFVRVAISIWIRPHLMTPVHKVVSLVRSSLGGTTQFGIEQSGPGGAVHLVASGGGPTGSWTISSYLANLNGQRASARQLTSFVAQHCPGINLNPAAAPPGSGAVRAPANNPGSLCLNHAAHVFRLVVNYQPVSRYWSFQWMEFGIFVALALAAVGACYWWVTSSDG